MHRFARALSKSSLGLLFFVLLGASSCGEDNTAPSVDGVADQIAVIEQELVLSLSGSDPDDDALTFTVEVEALDIQNRSSVEKDGKRGATFRWTPIISDLGTHELTVRASDGDQSATTKFQVTVTAQSGEGTAPFFVKPLGTGATLDLTKHPCIEFGIEVKDYDTPGVTIAQAEPLIGGAMLGQTSEITADFTWCPTSEQVEQDDRYNLLLTADDGDNPAVVKDYLLVLQSWPKGDCPGPGPVVTHTPQNVSSVVDLTIDAHVTDDLGLKYEPLLYYSTTPPSDPPDVTQMVQVSMQLVSGTMQDGVWAADVPNPVANQSPGASTNLYYIISAKDDDDAEGNCDHITQSPTSGAHQITVTNPGGAGGLGLCAKCSADSQCGGPSDLCVYMGGSPHCFIGCDGSTSCPQGTYCSFGNMTSVDGASARQCIPETFTCQAPPPMCTDDAFEDNDSLAGAKPITPGVHSLKSCPAGTSSDDEDWFSFNVPSGGLVGAEIVGSSASDLDLTLMNASGGLIDQSTSSSSTEYVIACVDPGVHHLRVYSWDAIENSYTLDLFVDPNGCGPTCDDDDLEPDDNFSQANDADLDNSPYLVSTSAICPNNEDFFEVYMYSGEQLHVALEFLQSGPNEDLDILLYQGSTLLTQCTEANPLGCNASNGQSTNSDEKLVWDIATTGTYYVVVRGWEASENLYDLCIGLSNAECPAP